MFVCKCVLYYCHRVATQLQLTNISYCLDKMVPTYQTIRYHTPEDHNANLHQR